MRRSYLYVLMLVVGTMCVTSALAQPSILEMVLHEATHTICKARSK